MFTMIASVGGIPLAAFFFVTVAEEIRGWMLWWSHLFIKWWRREVDDREQNGGTVRRQSTASSVVAEVSDFRLLIITTCLAVIFMFSAGVLTEVSMGGMWGFENSLWFVFVTTTTIGLGDYVPSWRDEEIVPHDNWKALGMPFMACITTIVGLSFTMAVVQSVGGVFEKEVVERLKSQRNLGTVEEGGEEEEEGRESEEFWGRNTLGGGGEEEGSL